MAYRPVSGPSDFRLPAGTQDVRGWDVLTRADGERVGDVADILVDDDGEVRYLDVDLGALRKHVLVPISQAKVDPGEDTVWVLGMTRAQIRQIPSYSGDVGRVTRDYEALVHQAYRPIEGRGAPESAGPMDAPRTATPPRCGRPPEHREDEDEAGDGRMATLTELGDFKVAEGDVDPRYWVVTAADGRDVGRVCELIVDVVALKVRYLVCELTGVYPDRSSTRTVLIPIGYVRIDARRKYVLIDALDSHGLATLPLYTGLPVTTGYETEVYARFTGGPPGGAGA